MFLKESIWIKRKLETIPNPKTVLDIGSSTHHFRTVRQPYIHENVFAPLCERHVKITYLDKKKGKGVNVVCDFTSETFSLQKKYDVVICANLLEHIEIDKLETALARISSLVNDGGHLIVTIPYIHPYHPDPMDNMLRPHIDDLKPLFQNFNLVFADFIRIESQNILQKIRVAIISIINIMIHAHTSRKLHILKINIKKHLFKTPIVTCIMFRIQCNS